MKRARGSHQQRTAPAQGLSSCRSTVRSPAARRSLHAGVAHGPRQCSALGVALPVSYMGAEVGVDFICGAPRRHEVRDGRNSYFCTFACAYVRNALTLSRRSSWGCAVWSSSYGCLHYLLHASSGRIRDAGGRKGARFRAAAEVTGGDSAAWNMTVTYHGNVAVTAAAVCGVEDWEGGARVACRHGRRADERSSGWGAWCVSRLAAGVRLR